MPESWRERVRSKRKALGITHLELAKRLGITRDHMQRIETGKRNPSPALQMEINRVLNGWGKDPELTLLFDYVRIRFPTHDAKSLIENVLKLKMAFMIHDDYGFYGYSGRYVFSNVQVLVSPPDDKLGTLLELKGQSCREYEGILLAHDQNWFDFFRECQQHQGTFKRIDLAINDHTGLLNIPKLIQKCKVNECVSVMRRFQGLNSGSMNDDSVDGHGSTLYVGSMKSDIYFCIYEKQAEQEYRHGADTPDLGIKNRFEIRLKNDRARLAVEDLINYNDAERTAFGIVTRYIRFVDRGKGDDHSKWPLNPDWIAFCGKGRLPLHLTLAPEPFDLRRTRAWIKKQVAPTLKVLLEIDGWNGTLETMETIKNTELKSRHLQILEQQTLGPTEIGGDYFES